MNVMEKDRPSRMPTQQFIKKFEADAVALVLKGGVTEVGRHPAVSVGLRTEIGET